MMGYKIANGFLDYIDNEAILKKQIEDKLMNKFASYGYGLIDTPLVEYLSLFLKDDSIINTNTLFKMTDSDGEILALRPDVTTGISRVVSTKLDSSHIKRVMYWGRAFSFENKINSLREFTQSGIEIFGQDGYRVDGEVISLAIECVLSLGIKDFVIEIGNVGYFNSFLKEIKLSKENEIRLSSALESKSLVEINSLADEFKLDEKSKKFLLELTTLFGSREIFKKAKDLATNIESKKQVEYLEALDDYLTSLNLNQYISYDFGLVGSFDYYTGVVFKGLSRNFKTPFLSGGRYDNLCKNAFGKNIKAVGAAFGVDRLLLLLDKLDIIYDKSQIDIALGYSSEIANDIHLYINELTNDGKIKIFDTYITDIHDFKNNAKNIVDAKEYHFIDKDKNIHKV